TNALTPAAATFADAGEAETAGAERITDVVAPHVAAGRERVVPERVIAAPRSGRRVRIAAGARVEEADHAELRRIPEGGLPRDVRVGVVRGPLDTVPVAGLLGVRVAHRPFFALGARAGPALFVVGVVFGDLLGLLLLHLLLGRRVEVLLDQVLLIRRDPVLVRRPERRHEERHGREQAGVHRQGQAGVHQALRVDLEVAGDDAPGVAGRDLEHETAELHLRLR